MQVESSHTEIDDRWHAYPVWPMCWFGGKTGRVALDRLRTMDRERLRKRLGMLSAASLATVFATLGEMFESWSPLANVRSS